jgi:hypothetical protein
MSFLNPQEEVVNPQGVNGIRFRAPPPDADPWNGFADWKVYDELAWEVMKRVVKSVFDVETAGRLDLVRDAYRMSYRLVKMQSSFPLDEGALNVLREEVYFRTQELRESDDRGLGIDHSVDISDDEVRKADCQVDHDRFVLLAEWRSLEKFVSAKEDLVRMIKKVYDDAYQRLEPDELDEDFVLFEFRRMLVRQKAEILAARRYLDTSPSSSTPLLSQPQE